jgi:hypothetical protein
MGTGTQQKQAILTVLDDIKLPFAIASVVMAVLYTQKLMQCCLLQKKKQY